MTKAIAVVDDEIDLVNLFAEALQIHGYDVCTFTDPLEALNHIGSNPDKYNLIISDFRMPHMTGNELCTKLLDLNPYLKVILMSAYPELEHNKAFRFVSKPIQISQLLEIVKVNLIEFQKPYTKCIV